MIPLVGECILNCEYNDKVDNISFYVTKNRSCTVLGLKSCLDLKLIKRINEVTENNKIDNLLSKHERLFRGIGCVKKPYSIKLKENAIPVAFPARKVPFAIQEKLKDTLDSLEKQKIIMKDMDSAEWVHPLVIVRKSNGTLRICLDPKDLNRSLKRHYFKLPTLDELTEDLAGATYFSTLDCTQGFLQIPKEILSKLHSNSHLGIRKTIERANLSFYWPGMNKQIQDMVMVCNTCQTYQNTQTREPMIPHEIVKRPWHKVACDLFHLYGEQYLLVVDYYSKFFELVNLHRDLSSENIISVLKDGIPTIVMSDNGPEFSSIKFREFSVNWEFKHIKSSPRYPQSNGLVERYIQTVKNTLRKSMMDKKDPFLALLDLRNTPIDGKHSPAN
ncbi:hypothetical protein D910_04518, partial [Dendroctonus ponderosae]